MNRPPKVSVVIATYNYGRYLPSALNSILAQSFTDYEIIVIDDGSTDDTAGVVSPYLPDPRIRYIRTGHLGQPKAKNAGLIHAKGTYVAFLDADDLWLPTKLEKQVALFQSDPDLGVASCRRIWIDEQGLELDLEQRPLHRGDVLSQIFYRNFICFSSSMVRREVLEDVGFFDEQIPLAIDYDLWLRVALKYRFDYVDEPLVKYRTGHANLSRRGIERAECVRKIIGRFLNERGGRSRIDPAVIRLAMAEHYCDTAFAWNQHSKLVGLSWYCRSLTTLPRYGPAWRGLATSWWPGWLRSLARSILGRKQDQPNRFRPNSLCG